MLSLEQIRRLFINFLVGGFVVASVSGLATWISPISGAIWWSFPFTLIPTIYFMRHNGQNNHQVSAFLRSTTFAIGLLVIVTYALSWYFLQLEPDADTWEWAILKATGIWFLCALLFYRWASAA
jgi:hypothetical protein